MPNSYPATAASNCQVSTLAAWTMKHQEGEHELPASKHQREPPPNRACTRGRGTRRNFGWARPLILEKDWQ